MGGSVFRIVWLLAKNFTMWVLAANLFAWPAAYLIMNRWLRNYAYHTRLNWSLFVMAGAVALGVALITVAFQTIRAARANPVQALKYE
jgi:putative ABC transport system permease protein